MWKYIVGFFAFIVIFCAIFIPSYYYGACTDVAPMDKYTLVYQGGPLDGRDYIKTMDPGVGRFYVGNMNKSFMYPATQRTYIISMTQDEGDVAGADELIVNCKGANKVHLELALAFKLVPENLQQFHEKLGLKYAAWEEQGWDKMLQEQVRQPLETAFQEEAKNYGDK